MELWHFDGYIHLFAAANLAWAGSHHFREAIDSQLITKDYNRYLSKAEEIMIKIENAKNDQLKLAVKHKVSLLVEEFGKNINIIKNEKEEADNNFVVGYKPMFLFTALVCLLILILSGLQQVIPSHYVGDILFVINLGIIYNVYIFIRAYRPAKNRPNPIWIPFIAILLLIILMSIVLLWSPVFGIDNCESELFINIIFSIFYVTSPFILHFIRAYWNTYIYTQRIYNHNQAVDREFTKLSEASDLLESIVNDE